MSVGAVAAGDAIIAAPSMTLPNSGIAKAIFHLMSRLLYLDGNPHSYGLIRRHSYSSRYASFIEVQVALGCGSSPIRVHGKFAIASVAFRIVRFCQGSKVAILNPTKAGQ